MIYIKCTETGGDNLLKKGMLALHIDDKTTKYIVTKPASEIQITPITKKGVILKKIAIDNYDRPTADDDRFKFYIRATHEAYQKEKERLALEKKKAKGQQ